MTHSIHITRKREQHTSQWSGGSTTQLAIYPESAVYSDRSFQWRISSAVVEAEESVFTPLPGFWRLLMILEGELFIEHEGHHSLTLQPFDQDSFSGGWTTRSKGKVRDFNLMLAEGNNGELKAIDVAPGLHQELIGVRDNDARHADEALYCVAGSITVLIDEDKVTLQEGDFMLISKMSSAKTITLSNQTQEKATLIKTSILYS
ncbi:HutD family protein [uncultured Brevibacillus sp.]|uniref:HutD/Ves family protein n=1 Tax=uncultured Brevibacillus sp. TaxID=169970 RepID=UPI0025931DE2|nr:HutD family protein [uncultured Brevibacillus sp.]